LKKLLDAMHARASAPASRFELSFQGEAFSVPKGCLLSFFEAHPDLFVAKSYVVQSTVPIDVFREFISSLTSDTDISLTRDNAGPVGLLAAELCFADLQAACAKLTQDPVSALESRIAKLESLSLQMVPVERLDAVEEQLEQLSSRFSSLESLHKSRHEPELAQLTGTVRQIQDAIQQFPRAIATTDGQITHLRESFATLESNLSRSTGNCQRDIAELRSSLSRLPTVPLPSRPGTGIEASPGRLFSFNGQAPLDGIIAHLTAECGGNVHDRGVVEMTCSSIEGVQNGRDPLRHHPKWAADFGDGKHFGTQREANAWLCFNFKDKRILPTHYTIVTDHSEPGWSARFLTSWVVEGSSDGAAWETIDERRDVTETNGPDRTVAFGTSHSVRCQYLRIRGSPTPYPVELKCFEVFGRLLEA
jgi:hypothetical protein